VQVGFADSGAHIRNMAFYNFPLVIEPSLGHAPGFGQFLPGRTARPESIASTSSAPALAPSTEAA
jgi:N-acyl-D-aspartate/D-glutamate deacylase